MARIEGRPQIKAEIVIVLNEEEAAALDALVCYGIDTFLEVFYDKMGKAYLQPHEKGLRTLFDSVRTGDGQVSHILDRFKDARLVMGGQRELKPL